MNATITRAGMELPFVPERQVTRAPHGHILTNTGVWSPDGRWIVYDIRSGAAGSGFDGDRIEMVNVETGEVRVVYESKDGACCGVVTFHPREWKVVFILGPESPTPDWQYSACHRQGVIVDVPLQAQQPAARPRFLDARDLTPPFTPGALRGGSHVHVWDAAGEWVSFTYEDHVLTELQSATPPHDLNQRNIGVSVPGKPVRVDSTHPRNHSADYFSVLVARTVAQPKPGSDEINRAFEEGWIGTNGYVRKDGSRQGRALAFLGNVIATASQTNSEVFVVDLPEDLTQLGDGPLCGTETRAPFPPRGVTQRRLTFTAERKFPGIQGPRHWLRSSPDGAAIAFLMKDDAGVVQFWTTSPNGGSPKQLTRNSTPIASAFTWSPDGKQLAHVMDRCVCVTDVRTGDTRRLTSRGEAATAPQPEACVFSPDGRNIAYVRPVIADSQWFNQVHVVTLR